MVVREQFDGVIGRTVAESTPWFPVPPHPGEDAPNVLVVLLDDTGFAAKIREAGVDGLIRALADKNRENGAPARVTTQTVMRAE